MRKLLTILVMTTSISCSENEERTIIENLNCSTTSEQYINFKIGEEEICWIDENLTRISPSGSGNCGIGYESIENPYMAMGVRGYTYTEDLTEIERSIAFNITFSCASYETQSKFYNLIKVGDFSLAKSTEDFGKFYIEYYENGTFYTTRTGNQSDSRIELLEVKEVPSLYGLPAALEVRLKASFNLYTKDGLFFKRVSGSSVKGLFYRPNPWGQEWND
jgi:hypothetical protein